MTFSGRCVALARLEVSSCRVPNDGIEPVDDVHPAAGMFRAGDEVERRSNTDKTADRRQHCQYCQRHPHRRRRLVRQVRAVMVAVVFEGVSVCGDVMFDVFVNWPDVLARFVT